MDTCLNPAWRAVGTPLCWCFLMEHGRPTAGCFCMMMMMKMIRALPRVSPANGCKLKRMRLILNFTSGSRFPKAAIAVDYTVARELFWGFEMRLNNGLQMIRWIGCRAQWEAPIGNTWRWGRLAVGLCFRRLKARSTFFSFLRRCWGYSNYQNC